MLKLNRMPRIPVFSRVRFTRRPSASGPGLHLPRSGLYRTRNPKPLNATAETAAKGLIAFSFPPAQNPKASTPLKEPYYSARMRTSKEAWYSTPLGTLKGTLV